MEGEGRVLGGFHPNATRRNEETKIAGKHAKTAACACQRNDLWVQNSVYPLEPTDVYPGTAHP